MPVPFETAYKWEVGDCKARFSTAETPQEMRKAVLDYFVASRVNDWRTVRREYWTLIEEQSSSQSKDCIGWQDTIGDRSQLQVDTSSVSTEGRDGEAHIGECRVESSQLQRILAQYRAARQGSAFYGFLDLPPEIRRMIYEHAVVQGQVPVPNRGCAQRIVQDAFDDEGQPYTRYQNLWRQYKQSGLRLFWNVPFRLNMHQAYAHQPLGLITGVSRAVHAEAVEIFYGQNEFIFPAAFGHANIVWGHIPEGLQHRRLMRHVSFVFDMREAEGHTDRKNLYYDLGLKQAIDDGELAPGEAMQQLHDLRTYDLELDWVERIDMIKQMDLRRLTLSFEEAYCPVGCCRKVSWLLDRFVHTGPLPGFDALDDRHVYSSTDWSAHPPPVIEVMGWVNNREREMMETRLKQLSDGAVEIKFTASVTVC